MQKLPHFTDEHILTAITAPLQDNKKVCNAKSRLL